MYYGDATIAKDQPANWQKFRAETVTVGAMPAPVTPTPPTTPTAQLPNVSVYRVGDGAAKLANTGNAVFIDTYSGEDSSLVSTVALPTAASGSNKHCQRRR